MDYSKVSWLDLLEMPIYENRLEELKVSKPIAMGVKLLAWLSDGAEEVAAEHDQLWYTSWDNVREKITDYDISLLVVNGWFIDEDSWCTFT